MYLPKNLWPVKPHTKLQALGVTTMLGASLIGCSTAEPSTAEIGDTAVSTPTAIATPTPLVAESTETLPTALPVETAVSTITPHVYHSPAVAQLTLHNEAVNLHWFDGKHSLLLPAADDSTIIFPGFTPLPPRLKEYFATAVLIESLSLRPTDADRPRWPK